MFDMGLLENSIDVLTKVFVYGSSEEDLIAFKEVQDIDLPCDDSDDDVDFDTMSEQLVEYLKGYLLDFFTEPRAIYESMHNSVVDNVIKGLGTTLEQIYEMEAEDGYVTCYSLRDANLTGRKVTEFKIGSVAEKVKGWREAESMLVDSLIKSAGIERLVEQLKKRSKTGKSFVKMSSTEFSDKALFSQTKEGAYLRFDNPKTILNHIITMSDIMGQCIYLKVEDR